MKKVVFVLLAAAAFSVMPSQAFAGCTDDLAACYYRVARRDSFMSRWTGGLDCELDYIECARKKILGR